MRALGAMIAVAALPACAMVETARPAGAPRPIETEAIYYETSPCFGACPVYTIMIQPDGRGTFIGTRFTAVTGERAFTATPAQYRAFAARLAPYRPTSGEELWQPGQPGRCEQSATDMPSVDVRWTSLSGDNQHLNYYYGCDRDRHRAMAEALRAAPEDLPVAALIGQR